MSEIEEFLIFPFLQVPADPVFGTPDKAHFDFFIFMFIRSTMYMSVISFSVLRGLEFFFMVFISQFTRLMYNLNKRN